MRLVRPSPWELEHLFGPFTRSIWICSPWISTEGARLLESALSRCQLSNLSALEIWLRVEEIERDAGFNDYSAVNELLRLLDKEAPAARVSMWSSPKLHAKVIWTDSGALVGSANLTGAGFGSNVELSAHFEGQECAAHLSIREVLRLDMIEVPRAEWDAFVGVPPKPASDSPPPRSETDWESFHERLLGGLRPGGIRG